MIGYYWPLTSLSERLFCLPPLLTWYLIYIYQWISQFSWFRYVYWLTLVSRSSMVVYTFPLFQTSILFQLNISIKLQIISFLSKPMWNDKRSKAKRHRNKLLKTLHRTVSCLHLRTHEHQLAVKRHYEFLLISMNAHSYEHKFN